MRTRSSGSGPEEEGDDSASNEENLSLDGAGVRSKVEDSKSISRKLQTSVKNTGARHSFHELDRRKSTDQRPSSARSRRPSTNWKPAESRNGHLEKNRSADSVLISVPSKEAITADKMSEPRQNTRVRPRLRSPWSTSILTLVTTVIAMFSLGSIVHSFSNWQLDTKGCRMSYMRPSFAKLSDFDTEHTRFASKYSVYLYREGGVDEDTKVRRHALHLCSANMYVYRSKEFQFCLYPGMLGATNKCDPSLQRRQRTSMMF